MADTAALLPTKMDSHSPCRLVDWSDSRVWKKIQIGRQKTDGRVNVRLPQNSDFHNIPTGPSKIIEVRWSIRKSNWVLWIRIRPQTEHHELASLSLNLLEKVLGRGSRFLQRGNSCINLNNLLLHRCIWQQKNIPDAPISASGEAPQNGRFSGVWRTNNHISIHRDPLLQLLL